MPERRKRRWWRCLAAFAVILILLVGIPVAGIEALCRAPLPAPAASSEAPVRPTPLPPIQEAGYRRNAAWTYFTFPEWYIVYSFEDFGKFLDTGSESGFPYVGHIAGFWRSFCTINRIGANRQEPLGEVKLMVYVIGISYSVELAIKGLYENTIGRAFEWMRGSERTPEDAYARKVAQDYAAFLYTVPWYKFPFLDKLRGLWRQNAPSPSALRSVERGLALSAEYGVKSAYAWVIAKALDVTGDPAAEQIMMVVNTLPPDLLAREPRIRIVRTLDIERQLVVLPRYKAFTDIVKNLAQANQTIVEIAGNDDILATVLLPEKAKPEIAGARELFSLPLGSRPDFRRAGFDVKVGRLTQVIRDFQAAGASVEHLYDY